MELTKRQVRKLGLLPCPFCGSPADIEPWHGGKPTKQLVSCGAPHNGEGEVCSVSPLVTGETPEEAAGKWNQRAMGWRSVSVIDVFTIEECLSKRPGEDGVKAILAVYLYDDGDVRVGEHGGIGGEISIGLLEMAKARIIAGWLSERDTSE